MRWDEVMLMKLSSVRIIKEDVALRECRSRQGFKMGWNKRLTQRMGRSNQKEDERGNPGKTSKWRSLSSCLSDSGVSLSLSLRDTAFSGFLFS